MFNDYDKCDLIFDYTPAVSDDLWYDSDMLWHW